MAWTAPQEALIATILGPELRTRLDANQTNTIVKLFDPTTPALAKQLLMQRLNALKTKNQADLQALPGKIATLQTQLTDENTLIDSILATLV